MSIRVFFVTPDCSASAPKLKRRSILQFRRLFTLYDPLSKLHLFYTITTPVSRWCNIGITTNSTRSVLPIIAGIGTTHVANNHSPPSFIILALQCAISEISIVTDAEQHVQLWDLLTRRHRCQK